MVRAQPGRQKHAGDDKLILVQLSVTADTCEEAG